MSRRVPRKLAPSGEQLLEEFVRDPERSGTRHTYSDDQQVFSMNVQVRVCSDGDASGTPALQVFARHITFGPDHLQDVNLNSTAKEIAFPGREPSGRGWVNRGLDPGLSMCKHTSGIFEMTEISKLPDGGLKRMSEDYEKFRSNQSQMKDPDGEGLWKNVSLSVRMRPDSEFHPDSRREQVCWWVDYDGADEDDSSQESVGGDVDTTPYATPAEPISHDHQTDASANYSRTPVND
ncbi:hypothetical protein IAT40_004757 [Kwoniella sp. CBS 6097]